MPVIDYESVKDPAGATFPQGNGQLTATWDELLWAALTVGRRNIHFVFEHGDASFFEAMFRLSLMRSALEQSGPAGHRLRRTAAFKAMDPSEKGAVSYFLGLNIAKLFAYRLLDVPWLMHLDVYRPELDVTLKERSRPDLVGQDLAGAWLVLESKGRSSAPDAKAKERAKQQARRLVSIGGTKPTWAAGAITYLSNEVLRFYWEDPQPPAGRLIRLPDDPSVWRYHYLPLLGLVRSAPDGVGIASSGGLVSIREADVQVGVHPRVLEALLEGRWEDARTVARETRFQAPYMADGLAVVAGRSWSERYADPGAPRRRQG